MAAGWYIIHVYSGYENRIEKEINRMLQKNELDKEIVLGIRVPTEEVTEVRDGKKKTSSHKLFPSYIMVELDLPEDDWKTTCSAIRKIEGVTGFVGTPPNKRPRPLSGDEARDILEKTGEIKGEKVARARVNYSEGEQIKINSGPFEGFTGTIDKINGDKSKLQVSVGIFGRSVPVEVEMTQVERV
jgi:transcriptional antiterminator NusG